VVGDLPSRGVDLVRYLLGEPSCLVEAALFLRSIAERRPYGAGLVDAVRCAEVLDALIASAASLSWADVQGG
jgi:hypothetical protein